MTDVVNTGLAADDGTGDNLRTAMQLINQRFRHILGTLSQITWSPGLAISATPLRQWTVVDGQAYAATSNHIAGATFAADLAAGRWVSLDVMQLTADLAAPDGISLVGGAEVPIADYAALRAYTGAQTRVYITGALGTARPAGIAGTFQVDASDTTSADNGGTVVVGTDGRRWKRDFQDEITPEWFGAISTDEPGAGNFDSHFAIQAALNFSAQKRNAVVVFSENYRISSRISYPANAKSCIKRRSVIQPTVGSGLVDAVVFESGNQIGRTEFPTLAGFSGVAVEIKANLLDLYIPQFNGCGVCFKFTADAGGRVLDSVARFDGIANCTTAVEFNMGNEASVIQGCGAYGNFITQSLNGAIFSGAPGFDDGLFLEVLAVDFVQPGGALLDNQISNHTVPRFTAKVSSWLGGNGFEAAVNATQLAKGSWNACEFDFVNAASFTQKNQTPNLVKASEIKFRRGIPLGSAVQLVALSSGLAGFNGGDMLYHNKFTGKFNMPIDLAPGQTVSRYFWHVFGDGDYQPFSAVRISGGGGLVVEAVHDQTATEGGRVAIVLRNVGAATVPSDTLIYISIKRT